MKRQGNKSANYLDFIPLHCASLRCTVDEMGNVTLFQENKGVFHFLAQKILKKPKEICENIEKGKRNPQKICKSDKNDVPLHQ